MLISQFFEDVYKPDKLFGKSGNTDRLYNLSIKSFSRTIGRDATLEDLTDRNVRRHMERIVANGRSVATANKDRSQLVAIWRYAFTLRMIEISPKVQAYKEPERTPVAWMADELSLLLNAVDRLDGSFGLIPRSLWWRAMIRLALDTGERIGAIFPAEWTWLRGQWFNAPAEHRKGNRSDRCYQLSPEVVDLLESIKALNVPGQRIFYWPYCENYLWKHYGKILDSAGLPSGRKNKFHQLRKTTGSVAYAAGLDPQDVLDHQYRRTTKAYLDPRFQRDVSPSDVLAKYLASPGTRATKPSNRLIG